MSVNVCVIHEYMSVSVKEVCKHHEDCKSTF